MGRLEAPVEVFVMTEGIGGAGVDDGSRVLERRGALGVVVGTWGLIILVVVELNA